MHLHTDPDLDSLLLSLQEEHKQMKLTSSVVEKRRTPWDHASKRSLYATREPGGLGYQEIAEVMSDIDEPVTHTAVHNTVVSAYSRIVDAVLHALGADRDEAERREIAVTPELQDAVASMLDKMAAQGRF